MDKKNRTHKSLVEFVKKRPYLFWYTKNLGGLSQDAVVEAVLNEGGWDDVQTILRLMGRKEVKRVFRSQVRRERSNYRPAIKHFFKLYFHA